MPDSLTALAILALVGLPGYVYLQLRGALVQESARTEPPAEANALNPNFETVLFGLVCALGGGVLSLVALGDSWSAIFGLYAPSEQADDLPLHIAGVVVIAFAGSLVMAWLLAGVVRWRHFSAELGRLPKTEPGSHGVDAGQTALGHGAGVARAGERPAVLRSARGQARWWVTFSLVGLLFTGGAAWGISLIDFA